MPRKVPTYRPPGVPMRAQTAREYDRTPQRRADLGFYNGAPWRRVKASKLRQDPLCEDCLTRGLTVPATHVHHVLERKDRPELAFDPENLQSLCAGCHSREHARRRREGE